MRKKGLKNGFKKTAFINGAFKMYKYTCVFVIVVCNVLIIASLPLQNWVSYYSNKSISKKKNNYQTNGFVRSLLCLSFTVLICVVWKL